MGRKHETAAQLATFQQWYQLERVDISTAAAMQQRPEFPELAKLDRGTVARWRIRWGWDARADELDAKARQKALDSSVKEKSQMLKRHAELGIKLQAAGQSALDKMSSSKRKRYLTGTQAIQAIRQGVEIERAAVGLPTWLLDMESADDDQLKQAYQDVIRAISAAAELNGGQGAAPGEPGYPGYALADIQPADQQE